MQPNTRNMVLAALVILLFAFAYWIWPTPYTPVTASPAGSLMRVNRFTGRVEFWHGSWK